MSTEIIEVEHPELFPQWTEFVYVDTNGNRSKRVVLNVLSHNRIQISAPITTPTTLLLLTPIPNNNAHPVSQMSAAADS